MSDLRKRFSVNTHLFGRSFKFIVFFALIFTLVTCSSPSGSDNETGPFLVTNATELSYVGKGTANPDPYKDWTLDAHYKVVSDIDMSGVANFVPISPWISDDHPHFTGIFDGNGKTISNLTVNASGDAGLFGYVGPTCEIKNIKMTNVDITSTWNAGAVGGGRGKFLNCVVIGGTIKSIGDGGKSGAVGGVFGWNDLGIVQNCYSSNLTITNVSGAAGGIVGSSGTSSTIKDCYVSSTVSVAGADMVGGIVGTNWGVSSSVKNCVALNTSLSGGTIGRVVGDNDPPATLSGNYGRSDMTGGTWINKGEDSNDGTDVTTTESETETWWKSTGILDWTWGNSESAPWVWNSSANLPKLWFED